MAVRFTNDLLVADSNDSLETTYVGVIWMYSPLDLWHRPVEIVSRLGGIHGKIYQGKVKVSATGARQWYTVFTRNHITSSWSAILDHIPPTVRRPTIPWYPCSAHMNQRERPRRTTGHSESIKMNYLLRASSYKLGEKNRKKGIRKWGKGLFTFAFLSGICETRSLKRHTLIKDECCRERRRRRGV